MLQLIEAILDIVKSNRDLELRYRDKTNIKDKDFSIVNLKSGLNYDKIYKDHVREGDLHLLLGKLKWDIWKVAESFEKASQVTYISNSNQFSWNDLGDLMEQTCLSSTDAMIANFALTIGADAIVTTVSDYAQISDGIDIFMPSEIADKCKAYNLTQDCTPG